MEQRFQQFIEKGTTGQIESLIQMLVEAEDRDYEEVIAALSSLVG